ncbi:nuclear transport factor 2 family protein [Tsuneonella mangrovi]|uniref:nuclear transport factor 2 family protein n=1 Tax=Tsuneonella mangrovi TaxID=1982042 RepID=UPI000BA22634|nr:nuclear transport factor 2 family protein [Tsuneonella mangrovi]
MTLTLADKDEIRDVLAAYAHAVDRRSWDLMERIFHDDATFAFGPVGGGWRDFLAQARAIIDPCIATQHQLGQMLIAEAGEGAAHSETYMTAMHIVPAGYPLPEVFPDRGETYAAIVAGRYVDRLEKRDGEWRIASRKGLYDWREFREIGAAELVNMPEGACGYHDERDPATPVVARWRGS